MEQTKVSPHYQGKKWPKPSKEFRAWLQKVRREFKAQPISVPDEYEAFSNVLFLYRKHLEDLCTPSIPVESEALKPILERVLSETVKENGSPRLLERFAWFQKSHRDEDEVERRTREAWEALGTTKNRQRVEKLLADAVSEAEEIIRMNHPFTKRVMKEEDIAQKKMRRVRPQVVEAGKKFLATLKTYAKARPISHAMSRVRIPSDHYHVEKYDEQIVRELEEEKERSREMELIFDCLGMVTDCVTQLQQSTGMIPLPIRKKGDQSGPLESKAKNEALLQMYKLFTACKVSNRKAAHYTHFILHAAGVESNFSPRGTEVKIRSLLKDPSTNCRKNPEKN